MIFTDVRADVHVVEDRRRAAVHGLDGSDHRTQVDLACREIDWSERADIVHPELKRQVVFATLVEALVTVVVTIDEPSRHQSAAEVDHSAAWLLGARRADLPDHLAVDHDVDRSVARPCVFAEHGQATHERFFHFLLPDGPGRRTVRKFCLERKDQSNAVPQLLGDRGDGPFESRATSSGLGGCPATRVHSDLAAAAAVRRMSSSSTSVARPCSTTILPSMMTVDTSRPTPTCTNVPRGWNAGVRWARRKSNRTRSAFFPTLRLPSSWSRPRHRAEPNVAISKTSFEVQSAVMARSWSRAEASAHRMTSTISACMLSVARATLAPALRRATVVGR